MRRRSLIPFLFVAAMLPVIAANGALIYLAIGSKPALVDAHPFEDGRTYHRALAAAAAQDALGWAAGLDELPAAGTAGPIGLWVRTHAGAPVTGLAVEVRVWRPVGSLPELRLPLAEASPGHYAGVARLPLAGQWQFDFVARRGDERFAYARRAVVQ